MSGILFISNSGEALPIVYRLRQEGTEAEIYLHNPKMQKNYAGIVEKVRLPGLRAAVKKADVIAFDITRPNDKRPHDLILLKMFGLKTSLPSVFGPLGDKLKKDHLVIGASEWCEEIELNRKLGSDIAQKIGFSIAPTKDFKSFKEGIKFLESNEGKAERWVMKPHDNGDLDLTYCEKWPGELAARMKGDLPGRIGSDRFEFMLQQFVEGVELSNEKWWDGERYLCSNRTFEEKGFLTGNLGPAIGSQNNVVWMCRSEKGFLDTHFEKLIPYLRRANYVGPVDVNTIVSEKDQQPYFLEFSPRFGYDAIYNMFALCRDSLTSFFTKKFDVGFKEEFAASERVSIPPFPYAVPQLLSKYALDAAITGDLKDMAWFWGEDVYKNQHGLACAGSDGIIGVVTDTDPTMWGAVDKVYAHLKRMKVSQDLQYRRDLGVRPEKHFKKLKKWGIAYE